MNKMTLGLVTTIIPLFNRAVWLHEAVESVIEQSYRPVEIIIVNDGSTDGAGDVADQLSKKYPDMVKVLHRKNEGPGPAREAGRQVARGEYIQYLDSDDCLSPRKFEVQVNALIEHPDCDVAYGYTRLSVEEEPSKKEPYKWSGRSLNSLFPHLLVDRWWNTNCPLYRRSLCDTVGAWSDLRYSQDWEYDARIGALGTRLVHCPEFVCTHRKHSEQSQTGHGKWLGAEDQVRFFKQLYVCACQADVEKSTPEMRHFARWVFARARQCAVEGCPKEAQALYDLSLEASEAPDRTMRLVGLGSRLIGWKAVGRLCVWLDVIRRGRVGEHTQKQSWMEA